MGNSCSILVLALAGFARVLACSWFVLHLLVFAKKWGCGDIGML